MVRTMEHDENWDKLVIKYTLLYCYENKEKFAELMPPDLNDLADVIFGNLQRINDKELQGLI